MACLLMSYKRNWEELDAILSQLPGHIYWEDPKGVILGCNALQARAAGFSSRKEMIGKTDYDMPWKAHADDITAVNQKVMGEGKPIIVREQVILPDGQKIVYSSEKRPRYNEYGDIIGILGISLDITRQAELEVELEKKNEELQEMLDRYKSFVTNQEHDMLTPYASLVAVAEELVDIAAESQDEIMEECAGIMLKSSSALCAYQKSLLDGIYLFNDTTELYSRQFNLQDEMETVEDMFLASAKEKSLALVVTIAEDLPKYLVGDSFRLRNCLMRLLSNAVKYTEEGGRIEVRCISQPSQKEGQVILDVQVEDTGVGIEADKLEVVFEPFSRLTLSNIGKYEGRGVGLAYVKKMVEEAGGHVDVTSVVGKGSVFRILLPMSVALSQTPTPSPQGKG